MERNFLCRSSCHCAFWLVFIKGQIEGEEGGSLLRKVQIKRIYDAVEEADGKRVLVDRLWPRGGFLYTTRSGRCKMSNNELAALIILDGFGLRDEVYGNAFLTASKTRSA